MESILPCWPSLQIGRPVRSTPRPVKLITLQKRYIPTDEPIDLLNVAFENPRKQAKKENPNRKKKGKFAVDGHTETREENVAKDPSVSYLVPDRETGLEGLAELRRLCPHRVWNFVRHNTRYPSVTGD